LIVNQSTLRSASRGTKQSNLRAHNERLLLSLIRHNDSLAKADIARLTGLSAQTISVITSALEKEGLLLRGEPIRGRIGQPSVPLSLNPDGAYSIGIKIGRRSSNIVLMNFLGQLTGQIQTSYAYPTPDEVLHFIKDGIQQLTRNVDASLQHRIAGVGISTPFQLWNWVEAVGAPGAHIAAWKEIDLIAELDKVCPYPAFVQNDASSACRAELVTGNGSKYQDYMYFFVGFFVGGGIVLNGSLYAGRSGNAGAVGSMPIQDQSGTTRQLIETASIYVLENMLVKQDIDPSHLWLQSERWPDYGEITERWIDATGRSLASAAASVCSVIDFETVIVDGAFPADIRQKVVEATTKHMNSVDFTGIVRPQITSGTVGSSARVIGAASLPLSARFLLDQNMLLDQSGS